MPKQDVTELDIFYISYDEPNCEEHWADLLNKVPWAKRVHGVKGFDAAHKECANQSETERFITVDGDNRTAQRGTCDRTCGKIWTRIFVFALGCDRF